MEKNDRQFNFNNLSVKDLIEARDMFQVHLFNKKNVKATAIGRYLIRLSDIDKNGKYSPQSIKSKRTLENSAVIDISWPCILVFVNKWEDDKYLVENGVSNLIPKNIFMPDGRVVPVCVVESSKNETAHTPIEMERLRFPTNLMGGGFPLMVRSQGKDYVASVGCLVSDGHKYYALTNKHVVGESGEIVESIIGRQRMRIGVSTGKSIGKVKFSQLYRGWDDDNMMVSCDVGLIEIDDLDRWKADIIGIPEIDEIYDLNTMNLNLELIAEHKIKNNKKLDALNGKIVGYGPMSGLMEGEILALFYRYKTIGGIEYVSDFLIGGKNGSNLNVHHGDSGTLWLLESREGNSEKKKYRPIALNWGQHEFFEGKKNNRYAYSLSTCLSNVCRELDVEIVRGWNIDTDFSWGKIGHYTIGNLAIDCIENPNLKRLMINNLENISFRREEVTADLGKRDNPKLPKNPEVGFCPLSDVPDIIWKQPKIINSGNKGVPWGRRGDENPNHYADVDAPTKYGKTLLDICDSPSKMTVHIWTQFYMDIDKQKIGLEKGKEVSRGLICFRIWQIYDYLVKAGMEGNSEKFIFGAGVLSHYIADCGMPLHCSYMADGDPVDNETIRYTAKRDSSKHKKGDIYLKTINPGQGVHVAFEDYMIDDYIDKILKKLASLLTDKNYKINKEQIPVINSGQAAAYHSFRLMKKTHEEILPKSIIEAFKQARDRNVNVSDALYEQFGEPTVNCFARTCRYLSAIWDSAWIKGNGDVNLRKRKKVEERKLIDLYANPTELPSMHLDTINPLLKKS